ASRHISFLEVQMGKKLYVGNLSHETGTGSVGPSYRKKAVMAGRILNRRELRKQADEAEARASPQDSEDDDEDDQVEDTGDGGGDDDEEPGSDTEGGADDESPRPVRKPAKAKAPGAKARKPRKPKAVPRMRARWGVFDDSMKQVAIFDYNQRAAADEKAAELAAKKNGTFFLQVVKEPMSEPAPGDAPSPV